MGFELSVKVTTQVAELSEPRLGCAVRMYTSVLPQGAAERTRQGGNPLLGGARFWQEEFWRKALILTSDGRQEEFWRKALNMTRDGSHCTHK
jgi:hypothetical protein